MKIRVVTDFSGNIVSIASRGRENISGEGAPAAVGPAPTQSRIVHEIDVPEKVARLNLDELRQRFKVKMTQRAELVESNGKG